MGPLSLNRGMVRRGRELWASGGGASMGPQSFNCGMSPSSK